jgi:translocation and assembly module TamB
MAFVQTSVNFIRRRPFSSAGAGIVVFLLVMIMGVRLWINSDGGRAYVLSQIDGRTVASLGTISASGLTGDPLKRMHLDRLSIADAEGTWLNTSDLSLKWTPRALLSRKVELNLASAGEITVLRRPETTPSETSGESSWSVTLEDLNIGKLSLAEGVAGPAAAFSVSGAFSNGRDAVVTAKLDIAPLEGLGDRFRIDAQRDAAGQFKLDAEGKAPAGGTFATLLQLAAGQSASLSASADGTIDEGDGYLLMKVSGEDAASMTAKIVAGRLTTNADLNATVLPFPDTLRQLLGANARFVLGADIDKNLAAFDLSASLASGTLAATGKANIDTKTLDGPAAIKLDFTGLSDLAGFEADLSLDGTLALADDVPTYTGGAILTAHEGADLSFNRLSGPLTVSLITQQITFKADLTGEGILSGNRSLSGLMGVKPHLVASGVYARDTGILTLSPSVLELPEGKVSASGTLSPKARTLDLRGTVDQALDSLPGGFGGRASGTFRAHGILNKPQIETILTGIEFSGLPDTIQPLIGAAPKLNASLAVDGNTISIAKLKLSGAGVQFDGGGLYRIGDASTLRFDFVQTEPLDISGNRFDLHAGTVSLSGPASALEIGVASAGGVFEIASRRIEQVATTTTLGISDGRLSGPMAVSGKLAGETLDLTADLVRADEGTLIENLNGTFGPLGITGRAEISPAGDLIVLVNAEGDGLKTEDVQIESLRATGSIVKEGQEPMSIVAHADGSGAKLPSAFRLDTFTADIKNNKDGYDFKASVKSDQPSRPFDFSVSGQAVLSGASPHGTFNLSGSALGEPLSTPEPAHWSLGETPDLDGRLSLLGGEVKAKLSGTGETALLAIDVKAVDFGALFALANLGDVDARLNGHGEFRPIGLSPSGSFAFSATSPIPGLDTSLSLDLTGRLDASTLKVNARSNYGKDLVLVADLALPITPSAESLARLDRTQSLTGRATLNGDLGALHTAALAYGHDIGGRIDAAATMSGSLSEPVYKANADVTGGIYEFGTTGLKLTDITLKAGLADEKISLNGSGKSAGNGSVALDGTLGPDAGRLNANLTRLLVYERDGDMARLSGKVTFTEDESRRLVSGKLTVDEARVSLDNLPSSGPKAIDVRWSDGDEPTNTPSKLRQSLNLDIDIDAARRVFVTGRGLNSEWALDLTATGTVSNVSLAGQATMVRGDLDLAGRPFVFDTGKITFDGPLDTARIAIDAARSVNGFVARVQVSEKPTNPVFELSSTPDLPQDEILSRLLFGRSSIDLSPVEAAQLASSIARLSGRSVGFDPAAELQAVLGVDRLSIRSNDAGNAELGVGQYLADDVYLQLNAAGADGSSVEVEWEPADQISVMSETTSTGENKLSIRWKKDY